VAEPVSKADLVKVANVRCQVRQAILDRPGLHPECLKGKWRRRCSELTRHYQRQRCLTYEHAEAEAFEGVLCMLWLDGKMK
jgi:hypothetical protein